MIKKRKMCGVISSITMILTIISSCSKTPSLESKVDQTLALANKQYKILAETSRKYPHKLPKTFEKDTVSMISIDWWTAGFVPGTMWYLYEASKDPDMKKIAQEFSKKVEYHKFTKDNHDIGFMIYCPFGNALRFSPKDEYKNIIVEAAKSLSTRFSPKIGIIRSWDFNQERWQYPVIIDNMMNLELLCAASELTGDNHYREIAVSHADKTMKYHFRPDMSTYHVVSYDTITGMPQRKETFQGLADSSEWARGQGWALYGYTMMYRKTKMERYLTQARKIATYIMNHPHMPEDKIPYWDFCDPRIASNKESVERDASAGAIMSSAFFDLSTLTKGEESLSYRRMAEEQLRSLCSEKYLAKEGELGGFLLHHSVGSLPHQSEVDVPLTYADYYFVEAMLRYKTLCKN